MASPTSLWGRVCETKNSHQKLRNSSQRLRNSYNVLKFKYRNYRFPGVGNGNPLQYSYLGNPTERGSWRATIHSQTWLSTHTHTHTPPIVFLPGLRTSSGNFVSSQDHSDTPHSHPTPLGILALWDISSRKWTFIFWPISQAIEPSWESGTLFNFGE